MAEAAKSTLAQGFVVVAENYRETDWAHSYASKAKGDKKIKDCGPNRLEIMKAVQDFLGERRRVVLLARAHPKGSEKERLIQYIRYYYPEIKVVWMSPA